MLEFWWFVSLLVASAFVATGPSFAWRSVWANGDHDRLEWIPVHAALTGIALAVFIVLTTAVVANWSR